MSTLKLIGLFLVTFIAVGSIIYNVRSRRPKPPVVTVQPGSIALPVEVPSATPPAVVPIATTPSEPAAPSPAAAEKPVTRPITANGWGRNPFLTVDEINSLNQPQQTIAETPTAKPAAEPPTLPAYALTGIIVGPEARLAIIDGRTLRAGSRIGSETVKEIKDREVVLEHQGQLRELRLKSIEETAAATTTEPKKETKP